MRITGQILHIDSELWKKTNRGITKCEPLALYDIILNVISVNNLQLSFSQIYV